MAAFGVIFTSIRAVISRKIKSPVVPAFTLISSMRLSGHVMAAFFDVFTQSGHAMAANVLFLPKPFALFLRRLEQFDLFLI